MGAVEAQTTTSLWRELATKADQLASGAADRMRQVAEAKRDGGVATARPPHIAELYRHIVTAMGGPEALAAQFAANYVAAKQGSATRQRMLGDVLRVGGKVTELGLATLRMSDLPTEELKQAAYNLFQNNYEKIQDDGSGARETVELPAEANCVGS